MMRNNELRDGLLGRVLMRLNETGADRNESSSTARKADQGLEE